MSGCTCTFLPKSIIAAIKGKTDPKDRAGALMLTTTRASRTFRTLHPTASELSLGELAAWMTCPKAARDQQAGTASLAGTPATPGQLAAWPEY
jgi:hypothetical protein